MPWAKDQIDPLTLWYLDVFFIDRERYLIFTNPLTKFTFFIFRYSKKSHPEFMEAFKEQLTNTLKSIDIDPSKYLQQCELLVPFEIPNKSASAHLSRLKLDYEYMIKSRHHDVYPPDDELFYNNLVTDKRFRSA